MTQTTEGPGGHVCPWWLIWTLDNPLRRLLQPPERVLAGLVRPADHCLDVGCGIGYFTIPMARMVGDAGSVTAVDVQPQMLEGVRRRVQRHGLESRVRLHQLLSSELTRTGLKSCATSIHVNFSSGPRLEVAGPADFALAFWMLHEVRDQDGLLRDVFSSLRPGGRFLVAEPKGHVGPDAFAASVSRAGAAGFRVVAEPRVRFSRAVLLARPS